MKLDDIDKKLLELMQSDTKKTTKELSLKLHLSVTAVYERIKKLERENVISKYVALLDKSKIDKNFVVFCHVKLTQHNIDLISQFEKEVVKIDEVLECYHVSGDYDYILKIFVKDMEAYREFMVTKLTTLQHIGSTHSTFMIGEVKILQFLKCKFIQKLFSQLVKSLTFVADFKIYNLNKYRQHESI